MFNISIFRQLHFLSLCRDESWKTKLRWWEYWDTAQPPYNYLNLLLFLAREVKRKCFASAANIYKLCLDFSVDISLSRPVFCQREAPGSDLPAHAPTFENCCGSETSPFFSSPLPSPPSFPLYPVLSFFPLPPPLLSLTSPFSSFPGAQPTP